MSLIATFVNIIFLAQISTITCFSLTNFFITKMELCESDNLIKFNGSIVGELNHQYLYGKLHLPFEMDEKYGAIVKIENSIDNRTFLPLFEIHEKYACKSMHRYLRQFIYDLERVVGLSPGVCPLRAGRYNVDHYLLNFHTIALQTFPFGKLKFSLKIINNHQPSMVLFCGLCEAINVIN